MTAASCILFIFFALILIGCGVIAQAALSNEDSAKQRKETSSWSRL